MDLPLPYKKIDPEVARKEGHKGYYEAACCYGTFSAIVGQLQKEVGAPYTGIPLGIMKYGEGGVVGWATLCGALNGAAAAINLVTPEEDWKKIIDELMGWYTMEKFPSEISNQYAEQGKFLVEKMKFDKVLPQNASHSPLCHVSVGEWCRASGFASGSSERSERCGRLTGDVAAQTAMLLNAWADKSFKASYKMSDKTVECRGCHETKTEFKAGGFTRGKMECAPCHGEDPHNAKKL